MRIVALVACAKSKRDAPTEAKRLYNSTWFRKARAYAESKSDDWYILSAKHGALPPDRVVKPYSQTLHDFTASERREWAKEVLRSIEVLLSPDDEVLLLAGRRYREHLVGPLRQRVQTVSIPMEGLGIGEQLRYLNNHLD
jgi:hypothetical protein